MDPWLPTFAVLVLIAKLAVSAPGPQSSILIKLVPHPQGVPGPNGGDPEAMWPNGVFLPPDDEIQSLLDLQHPGDVLQRLDHEEILDPLLLTGQKAIHVVTLLFSHGELFYDEVPHARALLRHQQERIDNGLEGHRLGSNRPESPFYRWKGRKAQQRVLEYL